MAVARRALARPPLVREDPSLPHVRKGKSRCGEVAGGTAAVMCCCPCSVMNLLTLVLYKLPSKICRRVIYRKKKKKRRREQQHDGLLQKPERKAAAVTEEDGVTSGKMCFEDVKEDEDRNDDKEMLERFYGTGFWRSQSQREDLDLAAASN